MTREDMVELMRRSFNAHRRGSVTDCMALVLDAIEPLIRADERERVGPLPQTQLATSTGDRAEMLDLLAYHHAQGCHDCTRDNYAKRDWSTCPTVAMLRKYGR